VSGAAREGKIIRRLVFFDSSSSSKEFARRVDVERVGARRRASASVDASRDIARDRRTHVQRRETCRLARARSSRTVDFWRKSSESVVRLARRVVVDDGGRARERERR
jgi:hypothetical protein